MGLKQQHTLTFVAVTIKLNYNLTLQLANTSTCTCTFLFIVITCINKKVNKITVLAPTYTCILCSKT